MSWIQSRQNGPPPIPPSQNALHQVAQSSSIATTIGAVTAVFGQTPSTPLSVLHPQQQQPQQQQQPPQWQQQNYNQPQQPLQSSIVSNNWNNSPTLHGSINPSQQQQQNNWQPQSLQAPISKSQSQFFTKQQPQSIDNYFQYQTLQSNFQQQSQPRSQNLNSNVIAGTVTNTQNILTSEQMMAASQIPNNEQFVDNHQASGEGWGDWDDWNDNNKNLKDQLQLQHHQQVNSQNVIDESFNTEINDNWKWGADENAPIINPVNNSQLPPTIGNKKTDIQNHINQTEQQNEINMLSSNFEEISFEPTGKGSGFIQNIQQPIVQSALAVQPPKPLINQQTVHSSPVNNLQQTQPGDNSQNTVASPVYVSQAKPVAQPPRQYAMTPATDLPITNLPVGGISVQPPSQNQQQPRPVGITSTVPSLSEPLLSQNPVSRSPGLINVIPSPSQTIGGLAQVRQYTIQQTGMEHPEISNSPGFGNLPPPPPAQTPPQQKIGTTSSTQPSSFSLPPPPPIVQNNGSMGNNNPYKRAGLPQHHRNVAVAPPKNKPQPTVMPTQFYTPNPDDFSIASNNVVNQEYLAPDNSEVIVDKAFEVENLEVAPNNDRNQYLQTGHLSEEGYNINTLGGNTQDQSNEFDNFPPPGLSRLVLGEPETVEPTQQRGNNNQSEIPPGLDRMVPGTELATSDLNMERHADGQDTISSPRSAFVAVQRTESNNPTSSSNINITSDRNLYLVPGDESDVHEQRVVTGVENGSTIQGTEQREIELDGENLEDQQQQQHQHHHSNQIEITREEPIEGANTMDPPVISPGTNHETESSLTVETNQKDISNPSTCNDDSDHRDRHVSYFGKSNLRRSEEKKRRPGHNDPVDNDKRKEKYESEESDLSSEKERRRYREGSVRKDRDSKDRDRRDKRSDGNRDRDRYRDDKDRESKRYDRDRPRNEREHGRYNNNNSRYETDSKYETEGSMRYERRRERDRGDRDSYEREYNRRDEKDRRYRRDRNNHDDHERDRRRHDRGEYREDRERDRRRTDREYRDKRSEYDDDYQRRTAGSRNARESDRETGKERSGRSEKDLRYNQHMYGYSSGYGYDPYSYYQQQQQYYEQLRRTNPQAYSEWYRKYYGGHVATDLGTTDGRESVHSGRSSANNDKERNENLSLNLIDGGTLSNQNELQEPQRSTPCKFTTEHSFVSLTSGLMVCVKPNFSQNSIANVVKIMKFCGNDSTRRLFHSFPGPLVRGLTHKKTIIEFCEDQIRLGPPSLMIRSRQNSISSICSFGQTNKASFTLMWNLLILLLRQNGRVIEPDIAELLMKNKTQFPYENLQQNNMISKSSSNSRRDSVQSSTDALHKKHVSRGSPQSDKIDNDDDDNNLDDDDGQGDGVSDELDSTSKKSSLTEENITEKFRNYLLYGNVNEALEWATENNLWGHALFLASKVDRRSHANVMMKFANKLSLNDPLQTLYQLMSGRTPSSVTSVQDEKWGDWRPHLAMILSNTSHKPELDRKAITTLGDSLYNRGDLFGAQFCYLMAQVGFGKYSMVNQESTLMSNSPNTVRLVLLGSSHHKVFKEFATNEAIMMTEIYEYACALNDEKFSITEFQPYKYLLATRMLDYGYHLKTLMYMEQIALHIQSDPSRYEPTFIEKIYKLADRLKYYDPVVEKTHEDQLNNSDGSPTHQPGEQQVIGGGSQFEDQKWIQDLRNVLSESNAGNDNLQTLQQNQTDINNAVSSVYVGEIDRTKIDQQFAEINQQFSELTKQYNNFDPMTVQQQQQQQTSLVYGQSGYDEQQQLLQQQQLNQQQTDIASTIDQNQYTQQTQQFYNPTIMQPQEYGNDTTAYAGYQQQQQTYDGQQQMQSGVERPNQSYDYWGQSQQTETTSKPTISMPNSISKKSGFYDNENDSNTTNDLKNRNENNNAATGQKTTSSMASKLNDKNQNRSANNNSTANSGWFGGIWNKLSLKPKNQMILPDDKNPTIVWDPDKKKWVNTDGEEAESESLKPPPKMTDLNGGGGNQSSSSSTNQFNQSSSLLYGSHAPPQQQQQAEIPSMIDNNLSAHHRPITANNSVLMSNSMSASSISNTPSNGINNTPTSLTEQPNTNKTPALQSNMFKMQRNRTLKKSYVDVFNPSGAPQKPIEPVLAPMVPVSVPQSGFFIPAPVSIDDSQQQSQNGTPQFYNPNQYGSYQQ